MLVFDVIETGGPSLVGRSWFSGEDWAVVAETGEDPAARTLARAIETFGRAGDLYRRGQEVHHVRVFDAAEFARQFAACGFTAAYGAHRLPPRRRAFFCTRGAIV